MYEADGSFLRDLLNHVEPVAVVTADRASDGRVTGVRYVLVNESYRRRFGGPRPGEQAAPALIEGLANALDDGTPTTVGWTSPTGESQVLHLTPLSDGCLIRPAAPGTSGLPVAVSEEDAGFERLLSAGVEAMIDPLLLLEPVRDASGRLVDLRIDHANRAARTAYGLGASPDPSTLLGGIMVGTGQSELFGSLVAAAEGGTAFSFTVPSIGGDTRGWFDVQVVPAEGTLVMSVRDITEYVEAERRARRAESLMQALLDTTTDALAVIDETGTIVLCNGVAAEVLGAPAEQLEGRRLDHPDNPTEVRRLHMMWREVLSTGKPLVEEYQHTGVRSGPSWRESALVPEQVSGRLTGRVILTGRDITERKEWAERIAREALRDPLTGVANRRLLLDRLGHDLARLEREPGIIGVLYLDLDRFKDINDTRGHSAGDEALRAIARRLHSITRHGDTVARMGGDEFVVVLPCMGGPTEVLAAAQRILDDLERPITVAGASFVVGASMGVVVSDDPDADPEDLVRDADLAMFRAKNTPGSRFELYDGALRDSLAARVKAEQQLRSALANHELVPWFQPEVDLASGEIVGFEALVRWRQPDGTVIPAFRFIEVAEDSGLIAPLGSRVLEQVCRCIVRWREELGDETPFVWMNLSARELTEVGWASRVLEMIESAGVDSSMLGFEITETAVFADLAAVLANLDLVRAAGFRFALDDYGTGYASLTHLKHLDVHALKIDRSFVIALPEDRVDQAIVAGTIGLASELGYRVIAEGIETEHQRQALVDRGCRTGQGFLFAPALPAEEIVDLVRRQPWRVSETGRG